MHPSSTSDTCNPRFSTQFAALHAVFTLRKFHIYTKLWLSLMMLTTPTRPKTNETSKLLLLSDTERKRERERAYLKLCFGPLSEYKIIVK